MHREPDGTRSPSPQSCNVRYLFLSFSCHAIALDYSLLDKFQEALDYEMKNYTILRKVLGDNEKDPRIEESNILLRDFTKKAVEHRTRLKKNEKK